MYLSFYRLKNKPFQISTDPRFLWLGEKHDEALATLRYGVLDNKGFLLLTGDVGTGKTTLINALLRTLDKNTYVAFIRDPALDPMDFFQYTAYAFGLKIGNLNSKVSFLIQFEEFLLEAYKNKRKVLLIIDEAQRMSQELLEEVRLLSNIEREDSKLLNIFFVGQIEFNDILHQPENRAIRQRITINYNIEPLTENETREYIQHRLEIASSKEEIGFFSPLQRKENGEYEKQGLKLPLPEVREELFTADAIKEVYSFSEGYPRLINIICDRALLTGYVEESKAITLKHIKDCVKELEIPHNKENSITPKRPATSLKNSLEELNREFEEKQKLESQQHIQTEDSPRDLIRRLEDTENVHYAEESQNNETEPSEEPIIDDLNREKRTNIAKIMLEASEVDPNDQFDTDQQLDKTLAEDQYQEGNYNDNEKDDTYNMSETLPEHERNELKDVDIPTNLPHEYMQREPLKSSDKFSRKKVLIGFVFCLLILAYIGFTANENQPNLQDRIKDYTHNLFSRNTESVKKVGENSVIPLDQEKQSSGIKQSVEAPKADDGTSDIKADISIPKKSASPEQPVTDNNSQKLPVFKNISRVKEKKKVVAGTVAITGKQLSPEQSHITDADQITNKIKQLKSLITFEKLVIPFPPNSNLPPIHSLDKLNKLVDSLLSHPSFQVTITYFSENQGTEESGTLPQFRASAIKSYLMGRGLEDSRITIKGKQGIDKLAPPKIKNMDLVANRWVEIDVDR